jgi:chromosome partitioning protein
MVLNAKGGCGKSTLATNIASYFAAEEGAAVTLADYDPQRSSLDWLDRRPEDRPKITGVAAYEDGFRKVPRNCDIVVVDAPARSHGKELTDLVKHAETIVIPVLPSTIDMQASTAFIDELKKVGKIQRKQAKIATVANRVRDNTLIWQDLDEYLDKTKVPYIAALREAQNYVRAYTRGLGIFELPEYLAWPDWDEWEPLTAWLRSNCSASAIILSLMIDRRRPVAGPSGALCASKFAPGEFVANAALYFGRGNIPLASRRCPAVGARPSGRLQARRDAVGGVCVDRVVAEGLAHLRNVHDPGFTQERQAHRRERFLGFFA